MFSDTVCRSCVVKDVKMHNLGEELQEIFEKLTSTKVTSDDGMPMKVCFICYSQLQRCKKFSEIALRSQQLLRDWLDSDDISHDINPCKLLDLQVVESLSVTVADTDNSISALPENQHGYNYMCVKERPVIVKEEVVELECLVDCDNIKIELEEVDETNDDTNRKINEESSYSNIFSERRIQRKPFKCRNCKKEFFKSKNLIDHMKDCFADFACKFCKTTFTNMVMLKEHMLIHYKAEERLVCDVCKKVFKSSSHLTAHMSVHRVIENKYACEICGKTFRLAGSLKTHMIMHEGTKSFVCDVCSKAFYTKGNLKMHIRCHTGERPFTCNTCGLKFSVKSTLLKHEQKLHIEVKPFQCSICYVSFNQEVSLTSHMRIHTADRSFKCDKCNKKFTSACNLKNHLSVHSQDRPFKCLTCGKCFKRSIHLKQHSRTMKCQFKVFSDKQ